MATNARVLLVRHGESSNNVLAEELVNQVKEGKVSRAAIMEDWLRRRTSDPPLTKMGERQAQDLANFLAPILAEERKRGAPVILACSPMLRACMTLQPVAAGLAKLVPTSFAMSDVEVLPDIFEVHGFVFAHKSCHRFYCERATLTIAYSRHYEGKDRRSGSCQSAAEIAKRFGYGTKKLPASGPWWTSGFESRTDAVARAGRVAQRLRSVQLREERLQGRGLYVCVREGGREGGGTVGRGRGRVREQESAQ